MKKMKQIAAIVGIIILAGMYIVTFIAALTDSEYSQSLFYASLSATFFVPVVIYVMMMFYKLSHKDKK